MKKQEHPILQVRRSAVPLLAIETSDPAASILSVKKAMEEIKSNHGQLNWETSPVMEWDIVKGASGLNKLGIALATAMEVKERMMAEDFLCKLRIVEPNTICFIHNAHRFLADVGVMQAVWNLRDVLKDKPATLVMLGTNFNLPQELVNDVVVITDALPNIEEMTEVVTATLEEAEVEVDESGKKHIAQILLGTSAYAGENALALSILNGKIDNEKLWERKRRMVESTAGLSIWRGDKETFDGIGGNDNLKNYFERIFTSKTNPVNCIGFIDEIEKLFPAGGAGDLSGVTSDQLRVTLTEMQDNNIVGLIMLGPPGTGKTSLGKAAASIADSEFVAMDYGAMTGGIVGESQAKIRAAFKTFNAISQGHGIIIATCNKIAALPPELRRRFSLGTFFVDLPSKKERADIWTIWMKRYGLKDKMSLPNDTEWTGAEIKACCDLAYRGNMSMKEAAEFIVPVARSAADQLKTLREQAHGRYISASVPGTYQFIEQQQTANGSRRMVS